MLIVRTIQHGEKVSNIIDEGKLLTLATGNEHALVKLASGERALVSGSPYGIKFGDKITRLFGHTHPNQLLKTGVSELDREALRTLGQRHSYLFERGDFYRFGPNPP